MAWTCPDDDTATRTRLQREIRVAYKTQDAKRICHDFVPLDSMELCAPQTQKNEMALVVHGEHAGKVVYPSRYAKLQLGAGAAEKKIGFWCKLQKGGKKKDDVLITNNCITRIITKERGPPSSI